MITITGATGHLGGHVLERLLDAVPAGHIRAAVRSAAKAERWAARGVDVVEADYERPETLRAALEGTTKLLLISSSEIGRRATQHRNVIGAAVEAGVEELVYTSILHADTSRSVLAEEHRATEADLAESGVAHVLLRNGWYTENYTENLAGPLRMGSFFGAAGEGRVAAASRADYAAAAVAVLTGSGHAGRTYELAGDRGFTMAELAATVSRLSGRTLPYVDMPEAEYRAALEAAGLPAGFAHALANADTAASLGDLDDTSGELARLIGRPTTTLEDSVRAGLDALDALVTTTSDSIGAR